MRPIVALLLALLYATVSASGQVAYWKGVAYTAPVCNNRSSCPMCWTHPNSIANQLARQRRQPVQRTVERSEPVVAYNDTALISMPNPAVAAMLGIVAPEEGETLYDIGFGDGRVMIEANLSYRCSVLGFEINPETYRQGERNVRAHCEGWHCIYDDATLYSLAEADIVTMYLNPSVMERLRFDTLKPGARVISFSHSIPGLECKRHACRIDGIDYHFFVYEAPE